jgi:hypothetical protein
VKYRIAIFFLLGVSSAQGQQLPVGIYEGLLGNSGVALTDSTSASVYNPSLLRDRTDNSFSLGGNAFGSMSSRTSGSEFSSLSLTPTYISTVLHGSSLVHEFFYSSLFSGTMDFESKDEYSTTRSSTEMLTSRFGYSMAFKSIPFALQYLARYSQIKTLGFMEGYVPPTSSTTSAHVEGQSKYLGFSLGVSGHARFGGYSFGVNGISRGIDLYKKQDGRLKTYLYSAGSLTTAESENKSTAVQETGYMLTIGHGFQNGDHQFLTDSVFSETPDLNHTYTWNQTFGYKMNSRGGHQFLCGLSHRISTDVKYFGQTMYSSVGYSWLTRAQRSTFGLYHSNNRLNDQTSTTYGVAFGSEFQY